MPLSHTGSRVASGAVLGAALALAFALMAVIVTLPSLRSSSPSPVRALVPPEVTAESWLNAPEVGVAGAGAPRLTAPPVPTTQVDVGLSSQEVATVETTPTALPVAGGFAGFAGAVGETEEPAVAAEEAGAPPSAPIESSATCGAVTCPSGQVCCNPSCGICTPPGEKCSQFVCGMSALAMSVTCGPNTCNVGDVCCNPTCGICTPPGARCDTRPCANPPTTPFSQTCGLATCNVDTVCCNPSCGICAKPGVPCRREPC